MNVPLPEFNCIELVTPEGDEPEDNAVVILPFMSIPKVFIELLVPRVFILSLLTYTLSESTPFILSPNTIDPVPDAVDPEPCTNEAYPREFEQKPPE